MAADSGGHHKPLRLEPFIHQVGGHSSMLQLDEDTICKPLIPQELNFYRSAPDCLKAFMPEFRGVTEVTFSEGIDGYLDVTAYLPQSYYTSSKGSVYRHNSLTEMSEHKNKHRLRVCHSGNILIEADNSVDTKLSSEDGKHGKSKNGCPLNPWVLRCHQEQMKRMKKMSNVISFNDFSRECILLENRVSKYEFPCILDIKMGTRQYGDDASLAKRQSHIAKVAASTSSSLGMRISGIQAYHRESGHFTCHNKYYGHSLTVDGFHQALYHFMHDGNELRQNIITVLLEKLHKLYDVVQSLHTFRFFTSSLLIIFSGKEKCESLNNKNIDCSDSQKKQVNSSEVVNENGNIGKDGEEDVKFLSNTQLQSRCENNDAPLCSNYVVDGCTEEKCEKLLPPLVDLCMIDFAHSTHSKMPGSLVTHNGPDEGYLFGLRNLIAHLEMLQHKSKGI